MSAHPSGHVIGGAPGARVDFDERPMLVFWETTRSCALACRHCRASATPESLP
jgi:MoaA/NifB/PqqE/SkfB family radical SAM enzyme